MTPIHWLLQTAADLPEGDDWLSAGEATALAGLRVAKRRAEWRLGRWTAKRALLTCLERDHRPAAWREAEVRRATDGAPEAFVRGQPAPYMLSITHRHGSAACVLAPRTACVGCDLERVEPRSERFVADYFTPAEQVRIEQAGLDGRTLVANLLWSAKESALKALREGLRLDTRAVEVQQPSDAACEGWRPLAVHYGDRVFRGWWRRHGTLLFTLAADPPPDVPQALPGMPAGWVETD